MWVCSNGIISISPGYFVTEHVKTVNMFRIFYFVMPLLTLFISRGWGGGDAAKKVWGIKIYLSIRWWVTIFLLIQPGRGFLGIQPEGVLINF